MRGDRDERVRVGEVWEIDLAEDGFVPCVVVDGQNGTGTCAVVFVDSGRLSTRRMVVGALRDRRVA